MVVQVLSHRTDAAFDGAFACGDFVDDPANGRDDADDGENEADYEHPCSGFGKMNERLFHSEGALRRARSLALLADGGPSRERAEAR